ncbi:organic cation transporter protein [Parasteatoda tepidariorum]|uniref:organic cation transporter protein n=1 Tax=Parasteatoda tepidariorum TaxID=114398 RepID=UPI001C718D9B|nr:organic cation transporter protein [Parasteatoda tepidariorum]XP_042898835.1 organic cation transporter protein [Parasteatoda tepidariorum]
MWSTTKDEELKYVNKSSELGSLSSSEPEESVEVSDVIGGYGPWQRDIFVLLFLASIPSAWHNLQMTFMAPSGVDYWCAKPNDVNISLDLWLNRTAVPSNLDVDNRCFIKPYWRLQDNATVQESDLVRCTKWQYDYSFYPSTIIDEWDLVCEREWLISFSKSIYNVGYLVAVLVFGQISDSVGRRPTLLFSYVLNVGAGFLSAFAPSFAMFALLRFFTAVGGAGFYTVTFVILIEMVSPAYRSMVGVAINFGWCLAFISLPGVAWIIRDWFWLQLALTLPKLLFISVFWVVPESPRWLLIRGEKDIFRKVVQTAAKKNGVPYEFVQSETEKLMLRSEEIRQSTGSTATILDLFKTPNLRKSTLILFYNWLVNSFIYFGLSYNTEELSLNPYLSFFLSGAVEFPAYLVTIKVISSAGRRRPLAIAMIIAGLACALTIPIPSDVVALKVLFPLVGKFCITATFATAYVYSAEIFPTVVRNVGLGTGSTVARIGSTVAPFTRELGAGTFSSLPDLLYSLLSVTSGCLIFLLPETNNEPFADTLKQAEKIGQKPKEESAEIPKNDV